MEPKTLVLEIYGKRNSNFMLEGTEGNPIFLNAPDRAWIPNTALRVNANGKIEKIRYIEGDTSILVEDQDLRKVVVNPKINAIEFDKSYIHIVETPMNETLVEFLKTSLHNASNPDRPENSNATLLYNIVDLSAKAEKAIIDEEASVNAQALLYKLRKKVSGGYEYNEEKISAYSRLLSVHGGDSPAEQFMALLSIAKYKPNEFVQLVSVLDSTISEEVSYALDKGVVTISDGVACFADGEKVIKAIPGNLKTNAAKLEFLSDFLTTAEGNEFLTELRVRVSTEKDKIFKEK